MKRRAKMLIKRIISITSALCLLLSCPVFAENKIVSDVAEATFTDGLAKSGGIAEAVMGSSANITVNDRGGRKGWLLQSASTTGSDININLSDSFAYGNTDGTSYTIEVDYLDADKSVFNIIYDSLESAAKETKCVYLSTSQKWTTATFVIDDAAFTNRIKGGYDFTVSVRSKSIRFSSGNVIIGGVRVYKHKAKNPVRVTKVKTSELGNIFGNGQEKKFDVTFENYSEVQKDFDVTYRAYDASRAVIWQSEDKVSLGAKEQKTLSVTAEAEKYGVYDFDVSLSGDGFSYSDSYPFSYINNTLDGSKNDLFGYNVHFTWDGYDAQEGIDVIQKSNAGFVRNSLQWHEIDVASAPKFTYVFPKKYQNIIDVLNGSGIGLELLLTYGNTKYEGTHTQTIPTKDEAIKGFAGYTEFLIQELLKQNVYIHSYEIWNEPNIPSFNKANATAEQYGKFALEVAKAIRKYDQKGSVGIMSITNMKASTTFDYFETVMKTPGIADYADAITVHPYSHDALPEVSRLEETQKYKDIYTKYADGREPTVNYSELGYYSFSSKAPTTLRQATVNVREYIAYNAKGLTGAFAFYDFARDGSNDAHAESNFGHVETSIPDAAKVNYAARENFIADANMNKVLMNAKIHKIISEDNGTFAYIFKRPADNGLAMPVWTNNGETKVFSFKSSAPSLKLIDIFGNEETIYGKDGVYSLMINDLVQYIEGDIADVEICENPVGFAENSFSVSEGSLLSVVPKNVKISGLTCEIETPKNFEVINKTGALDENAKFKFRLPSENGIVTSAKLHVYDGEKQAFVYEFPIETKEAIEASVTASPSAGSVTRWDLSINIKNNSIGSPISGKIKITEPKEIAGSVGEVKFDTIPENSLGSVRFTTGRIPQLAVYPIKYTVYLDSGARYDFSQKVDFTVARYAKTKPKIDAVLENGEWDTATYLYSNSLEQVYLSAGYVWNGVNDLSAKTIISYDEDNLYLYLDVTDDIHSASDKDSTIWKNDSVQFGITFAQREHDVFVGGTFTEISFSDTPDGAIVWRHASEGNAFPTGKVESAEVAFRREGTHSYYEVSVPWKEITANSIDFDTLSKIGFSMLVNDNDGQGRKGWIEYGSGIGKSKDTSLFTFLNVLK